MTRSGFERRPDKAIEELTRTIGMSLTKRKFLQMITADGALVGG